MIFYTKFWLLIEERGISQYKLINTYKLSPSTLHHLKLGKTIRTSTVEKICLALNCQPIDIMTQEADDELLRIICYLKAKEHKTGSSR